MSLQHSSIYNNFQKLNKIENNNPESIKFWGNSDSTRKKIVLWHSQLVNLISEWKEESEANTKNKILMEIYKVVTSILSKVKQNRQYYEARLFYMQVEEILIGSGINPVNIRAAKEDENSEDANNN